MTELEIYQNYWWLLIAVLGAALVFMLFVLGGQTMLMGGHSEQHRQLMVNSLGRKWELTFTSLVVFGGAFFASFPLFYSTSFGGAYWLWMTILFSFVLQAVSYEFRRKRGNLYGTRAYDTFLLLNGVVGCVLLGAAVGTFFFGGPFEVSRGNLAEGANPVISMWAPSHGLEVMGCWQCMLLGVTILMLARTLASLYFINNIRTDSKFEKGMRRSVLFNGLIFALLFVAFTVVLLLSPGVRQADSGVMERVPHLYLNNLIDMWWWGLIFVAGVVLALYGIGVGSFTTSRGGIWSAGIGTALVVVGLFAIAGYGHTGYLPSTTHLQSTLTLANSSSSFFTLKTMSVVSLLVPFVLAYIVYVWRKMNSKPISADDVKEGAHQY